MPEPVETLGPRRIVTRLPELVAPAPPPPSRLDVLRHINDHLLEQRDLATRIGADELGHALDEAQRVAHRVMVAEGLKAR